MVNHHEGLSALTVSYHAEPSNIAWQGHLGFLPAVEIRSNSLTIDDKKKLLFVSNASASSSSQVMPVDMSCEQLY